MERFVFPLSVWLDSELVSDMVGGKCNGMERVVCLLGASLGSELVLDIVGGKCNGMERAACPLGGGNTVAKPGIYFWGAIYIYIYILV